MVGARPIPQVLAGLALALALVLLGGCAPDCQQACRHMLKECALDRPDYSIEDCSAQCERFLDHYDDKLQRAEARSSVACVRNASCDDLRSGTPCYDESVYVW